MNIIRHLGYNLPMHHYLFVNDANKNEYTLKQFFGLVFEDLVAEEYELKVILPEGATEIKVILNENFIILILLSLYCLLMSMINITLLLTPI